METEDVDRMIVAIMCAGYLARSGPSTSAATQRNIDAAAAYRAVEESLRAAKIIGHRS